jgi:hypothetical protein
LLATARNCARIANHFPIGAQRKFRRISWGGGRFISRTQRREHVRGLVPRSDTLQYSAARGPQIARAAARCEKEAIAQRTIVRPDLMFRTSINANARCLLALLLLWPAQSPASGQQSRPKQAVTRKKTVPVTAPKPAEAPVPFAAGETLTYQLLWTKYRVRAATLVFSIVEKRDFYSHSAWHFRLVARTINTMRDVYPLDDQFDSYTDAVRLASLQYEMYLRELGSSESTVDRIADVGAPAPAAPTGTHVSRVPPGTRDAVGFLYALRANDWQRTPELDAPVFDAHNLYDAHARLESADDSVQVPAGQLPATRIAVSVFANGKPRQDITFHVWLGKDSARTPLLIEADVPIGNARVELLSLPKR